MATLLQSGRRDGVAEISGAVGRSHGWAWIAVRDEGPGIAPEDQALVFDRFWRGNQARHGGRPAEEHRSGLGLAIVRQVLESLGGAGRRAGLPPQAPRIVDDCGVWNVGSADPRVHAATRSDVPVLLLSGSFDGVTPPSWARVAAEGLSRARVVEFPGLGHDVLAASDCGRAITVDFLERPEGGYDTGCLDRVTVPEFVTGA